jgi:hypothetical protein
MSLRARVIQQKTGDRVKPLLIIAYEVVKKRLYCLSIWGFGWKSTAITGTLKTQSRQDSGTPIYGI